MDPKARSLGIFLVISVWMWFLAKKKTLMKNPEFVAAPTNSPLFALSVFLEKNIPKNLPSVLNPLGSKD